MAVGMESGVVKLYTYPSIECVFDIMNNNGEVNSLSFSSNDEWLVVCFSGSPKCGIINIEKRELTKTMDSSKNVKNTVITPNGKYILFAYHDILVYSRETGHLIKTIESYHT
mmetsp:Transcript_20894/g.3379  ORF Transcript_20894/g.3379 Transcript_20894/m.3379 type:complete len:112 (-) Transcript_20894:3216-3551(-)